VAVSTFRLHRTSQGGLPRLQKCGPSVRPSQTEPIHTTIMESARVQSKIWKKYDIQIGACGSPSLQTSSLEHIYPCGGMSTEKVAALVVEPQYSLQAIWNVVLAWNIAIPSTTTSLYAWWSWTWPPLLYWHPIGTQIEPGSPWGPGVQLMIDENMTSGWY
jgi:hypothetical protein